MATAVKISCSSGILKSRALFVSVSPFYFFVNSSCWTFLEAFTCSKRNNLTNIFKTARHVKQQQKNKFPVTSSMYRYSNRSWAMTNDSTRSLHIIRELKNHDDGLVDDDRKWVTLYCASATSKFRRRGVVDDAKQSRITSSCNPQASAGINPLF